RVCNFRTGGCISMTESIEREPEASTMPVYHLIDGDLHHKGFGSFLKQEGLADREYDYSVLAVFGGQSTGKSTLLNRLFNTDFAEMQADDGRQQTTQGVWLSRASGSNRLLLLDFEGADSAERGEDHTFEKKLGLFALAMADVLLINLFQYEIGRRNAMSVPLLENILQINFKIQLQLAESQTNTRGSKKLLMFVVRDYDGRTPKSKLSDQLLEVITQIWSRITKPDQNKDDELQRWFDFRVQFLPHISLPAFQDAVVVLRDEFLKESTEDYAFKSSGEWRSSGVVIGELDSYSQSCWEAIKSDRDINIPEEKELVARHRAAEASKKIKADAAQRADGIKQQLKNGEVIKGLRKAFKASMEAGLIAFREETQQFSRYQDILDAEMVQLREEYAEKIESTMEVFYASACKSVDRDAKDALATATKKIDSSQDYNPDVFWLFLRKSIDRIAQDKLAPGLANLVKEGVLDAEEKDICCAKLKEGLETMLRYSMDEKAATVGDLMADRFLFRLLHDAQGIEESVKADELASVRGPDAFVDACKVLEALSVWRLKPDTPARHIEFPTYGGRNESEQVLPQACAAVDDDVLIPSDKLRENYTVFVGKIDQKLLEAKLSLKDRLVLPSWVYIIIFVLGIDEMMWAVSNPVVIIAIVAGIYLFAKNLVRQIYYDTLRNGNPMVKGLLVPLNPFIDQYFTEPTGEQKSATAKKND
ncbi:Protein SEY1, partial [Diplonema papillatum]